MTIELLDTKSLAAKLGLSTTWLEQLRGRGEGPRFLKLGKRCLYRPEDVSEWLATKARSSTSQAA